MKKALAVLAVAIAVGGCVTVVPVPVRTAPPPASHPDSARHQKPPMVVVITDPQDSARIRREHWREHPTDTVVEVTETTGKTDHRPPWAERPHEGGRQGPPPGLAKHDSLPPGQARKDGKPDKPEHGPPDKEGRPDVEHVVLAHPEAPGQDKKPDQGVRGDPGNKDAEPGHHGVEAGKKGMEPSNKGAEAETHGAQPGDKGVGHEGKDAQPGNKGAQPGDKGVEHEGKGAQPGDKGAQPGDKTAERGGKDVKPGNSAAEPGNKGAQPETKGATPGERIVEPSKKMEPSDKGAQPGNQGVGLETRGAAPGEKIVEPGNGGADSGSKVVAPDSRTRPDQARQGGGKPGPAPAGGNGQTTGAAPAGPAVATVAQLLGTSAPVGERVQVTGTCLAAGSQSAAGGAPAGTDDWQLGSGGAAIWVTGPRPAGCSPATGSRGQVTIVAKVAEDQLPGHGKKPGGTRRYLVIE
jgi:hypothetical protein